MQKSTVHIYYFSVSNPLVNCDNNVSSQLLGAMKMSTNVPGSRYRFGAENFAGTKIFIGTGNVSWTQYRNARFTTETRHCLDSLLSLL